MKIERRLLLFGLLGPALGFVVAFWVILQIFNVATGGQNTAELGQLILLPFAYVLGILPAVGAAAVDDHFKGTPLGPLYTCGAGYLMGFIPIAGALIFIHSPFVLIFGLVGAVPALICSLIARLFSARSK